MPKVRFLLALLFPVLLIWPVAAQDNTIQNLVSIEIEAAFDGNYRPNHWFPLRVRLQNNGGDVNGRLIVRPEGSGAVVTNAYSVPVSLPNGSTQAVFLYMQAQPFARGATLELLDADGARVAEQIFSLNSLEGQDKLYAVVSDGNAATLALNGVAPARFAAFSTRWSTDNVPDYAAALHALDSIILYNVDSSSFTTRQRAALLDWTALGGHLLIVGGPRWQATASGFDEILPLLPDDTDTIDDVSALATYAGLDATLDGRTVIATGAVAAGARVLIETDAGVPLLVRGTHGAGTVDYLAADPALEPLASWVDLPQFWLQTFLSPTPETGWRRGFLELGAAATAIAVLPDVELLPPVLQMMAYIAAYILLIGPINYMVLTRLNRRSLAWLTIPALIIGFSSVAWSVGFNLRGNDLILSRLNVIQSFPDTQTARVDQLIGVLSPRRDNYQLSVADERMLRVMPALVGGGFLQQNITQSTSEIVQRDTFSAENITIDGGIFANFATTGVTQAPDISGSVTITYVDGTDAGEDDFSQNWQGVVRNDSDFALEDAVIYARNRFYRLPDAIAAGDVVSFNTADFEVRRNGENWYPPASPLASSYDLELGDINTSRSERFRSQRSALVLLDRRAETERTFERTEEGTEELVRRESFLRSFFLDQYNTDALGDAVYLVGWSNELAPDVTIEGVSVRDVETALYIVQLETNVEQAPPSQTVALDVDQFTWFIKESNLSEGGNEELRIFSEGFVEMRFTPLPSALLDEIHSLTVALDRSGRRGRDVALELWNWEAQEWVVVSASPIEVYSFDDPARFIGPGNIVDVRLGLDIEVIGNADSTLIDNVRITQTGNF